ncbi:acetoin utilization protein AcuB [Desulfitispora alkaliphila]|uniref:CBS domain-containing protein n=1 Tax=Desulfitispora alkaliphila TaxID=622674 RepID=UPI003D196CE9
MLVEEVMQTNVVTISPQGTLYDALTATEDNNIRHLPVVIEDNELVGIISTTDLVEAKPPMDDCDQAHVLFTTKVKDLMVTNVITVHPLDHIDDVVDIFSNNKIGCVPVVSGKKLLGLVTETDMWRALAKILGVLNQGSLVKIEIPDEAGHIAKIGSIIYEEGMNITSILMTPPTEQQGHIMTLRLQSMDIRGTLKGLEEAGYKILWPQKGMV